MRTALNPENAAPRGFDLQGFIMSMERVTLLKKPSSTGNAEAHLYLQWLGDALRCWREHELTSVRTWLKNLLVQHLLYKEDILEDEDILQNDPLWWPQVAQAWKGVVADLSSNLEEELRQVFEAQRDIPESDLQELRLEILRLQPEDIFTPTLVSSLQVEHAAQLQPSRQRGEALMMCMLEAILARWPKPPVVTDDAMPTNAPKPKKGKKRSSARSAGVNGSVLFGVRPLKEKS